MSARIFASEGLPLTQASDVKQKQLDLVADAVIVGSGVGGALVAYELARSGRSVIVLEAGPYVPATEMQESQIAAWERMYADQSWQQNKTGDLKVLQGNCVGGGSVVSAAVMQRTPDHVLRRWQSQHGLTNLTLDTLEPYFQALEENLSIHTNTDAEINLNSRKVIAGAEKLGLRWKPVARSVKECAQTGHCLAGCKAERKQSMLVTYLPWAQACGAQIYADTTVTKVQVKKGKVTGVLAEVRDSKTHAKVADMQVKAKVVVLAAGAVATPLLLKQSKLGKQSGQLGKNLSMNPALAVYGRFQETLRAWRGTLVGASVEGFSRQQGAFSMQAAMPGPEMMVWATASGIGEAHFDFMGNYPRYAAVNVFMQDEAQGSVEVTGDGKEISWEVSRPAFQQAKKALATAARTLFAAGAEKVFLPSFPPLAVSQESELDAALESLPYGNNGAGVFRFFSWNAHGSCRMGSDPEQSVVNPYGECHDVKNLFVSDASILPAGLEGNPELTVAVLASYIGDRIRSHGAEYFG